MSAGFPGDFGGQPCRSFTPAPVCCGLTTGFGGGIRMRLLDLELERAYRDLGEFLYARLQPDPLDEGDLVLLDLMRNEIWRLEEERRLAEGKARGHDRRTRRGKEKE